MRISYNYIVTKLHFFVSFLFFFDISFLRFTDEFLLEPEKNFGQSKKFIDSLEGNDKESINGKEISSDAILDEAKKLASCTYEENTEWGKEASILV